MSGYPNPPESEDVLGTREDVLDSGTPGRPRRWIAAAGVAIVALVGWNVLGSGPDETIAPIAASQTFEPPSGWTVDPEQVVSSNPDQADQLTFVDDQNGFLVQYLCSQSTGGAACPRRLLATTDGGSSWEARATIPVYAEPFHTLLVESELRLALIDTSTLARMARSFDGGRSWRLLPITRAEPAAAPEGALVVADIDPRCAQECAGPLAWIDPTDQALHLLPSQPAAAEAAFPGLQSVGTDGDIVVGSSAGSAGLVSMSTDGGLSWNEARLDVPQREGWAQVESRGLAAGNGRAFVFVQAFDEVGLDATYSFRTDDGGRTWVELPAEGEAAYFPVGVLDGELIATDLPGRIFRSEAGGTRWVEAGSLAGGPYLYQAIPDSPVLATVLNSQGNASYHLSTDLISWTPMPLPGS